MPLTLTNSFSVAAPPDDVFALLLDVERVASCLPGAVVQPGDDPRSFRGAMKVKLGPLAVSYQGTVDLVEVDEDARMAVLRAVARERHGQGTAAATIRNSVEAEGTGTRVTSQTELDVTGRQAQFGRGIMQDVADRMLGQFADRMQALLGAADESAVPSSPAQGDPAPGVSQRQGAAAETSSGGTAPRIRPAPAYPGPPEALDVGSVMFPAISSAGLFGLGALAGLLLGLLLGRRPRRGITLRIDL